VADLVQAARAGSHEALGRLLEDYRDYLLTIAHAELDSDLRAKAGPSDLVQETFLEAQRDFAQFQGETPEEVLRWLREILRNTLADFVRRYKKTGARDLAREQLLDAGEDDEEGWLPSHKTDSPAERLAAGEAEQAVRRAIERLPPEQRQVVMLRHDEALEWSEVAHRLSRSVGAVQKLWFRALKRMREQIAEK
jgi:RNA polymerase sigma-70 factor (ECF subfamily)